MKLLLAALLLPAIANADNVFALSWEPGPGLFPKGYYVYSNGDEIAKTEAEMAEVTLAPGGHEITVRGYNLTSDDKEVLSAPSMPVTFVMPSAPINLQINMVEGKSK